MDLEAGNVWKTSRDVHVASLPVAGMQKALVTRQVADQPEAMEPVHVAAEVPERMPD